MSREAIIVGSCWLLPGAAYGRVCAQAYLVTCGGDEDVVRVGIVRQPLQGREPTVSKGHGMGVAGRERMPLLQTCIKAHSLDTSDRMKPDCSTSDAD